MPKNDDMISYKFQPAIRQIQHRISSLPPAYQEEVLNEVGDYGLEVLRKYPRQKYITREQAYPKAPFPIGWFSEEQRGWFFAVGIHKTPHRRTGALAEHWALHGSGEKIVFQNDMPGIQFVMGEKQSRHEKLVGWKKAADILAGALTFRSSKFRAAVQKAYQRAIRKVKLG